MPYVLDHLGQLFERIPELAGQTRGYGGARAGSPVERELIGASAALRPLVEQARTAAALRMAVAEEHMGVIGGLVRNERVVFSIYSLARVVAEMAARTWWLLDPRLTARERASRILRDRLYSIDEQVALVRGTFRDDEALDLGWSKDPADARNRVVRQAEEAGVTPADVRGTTTLLEDLLKDESITSRLGTYSYKVLSAFSHGTLFALHDLVSRASDAEVDDLGTVTGIAGTTYQQELHALQMALLPFMRATHRIMEFNGWSDMEYAQHMVDTADELERCRALDIPNGSIVNEGG